jgi:hypothetical protein
MWDSCGENCSLPLRRARENHNLSSAWGPSISYVAWRGFQSLASEELPWTNIRFKSRFVPKALQPWDPRNRLRDTEYGVWSTS